MFVEGFLFGNKDLGLLFFCEGEFFELFVKRCG